VHNSHAPDRSLTRIGRFAGFVEAARSSRLGCSPRRRASPSPEQRLHDVGIFEVDEAIVVIFDPRLSRRAGETRPGLPEQIFTLE